MFLFFLTLIQVKSKVLWSSVIPAGFAIFSMLFGSGNIMFPIHTGKITGSQFLFGTLGFFVTGIVIPMFGLLGVVFTKGNKRKYFKELPYPLYFLLISLLLALLGPFYVIPRCIHVAYSGFGQFVAIPFWLFSAVFTACLFILSYDHARVVGLIGKIISPFKIGGLLFIAMACLYVAPGIIGISPLSAWDSIRVGVEQGYQTMDLPAGIFFSAAVYMYLARFMDTETPEGRRQLLKNAGIACVIGEVLIAIVYLCFIKLGASYAPILEGQAAQMYLPVLTRHALGVSAVAVVAFTLFFSCLAVALILADLYTTYLYEDIFRKKQSRFVCMPITFSIAYFVSLKGCTQLCNFFLPTLTYIYPIMVVFAIYKLIRIYVQTRT